MGDFCAHALAYTTGRPLKEFRGRKTTALTPELIESLHSQPWLFVLDGLERVLVAYNRYDAAQAGDEDVDHDPDSAGRSPRHAFGRPTRNSYACSPACSPRNCSSRRA